MHINSILGILTLSVNLTYMHVTTWKINLKIWNSYLYGSTLNGDVMDNKQQVNTHHGS